MNHANNHRSRHSVNAMNRPGSLRVLGGALLIGVALFMALGFAASTGHRSLGVTIAVVLITMGIPAGAGLALIRGHYRDHRLLTADRAELRLQTWESELVKLAAERGGKLTVVEAVAATGLRVPQVEEALRSLAEQGVADLDVTDSGMLVYRFPDIQLQGEKGGSKPILES